MNHAAFRVDEPKIDLRGRRRTDGRIFGMVEKGCLIRYVAYNNNQ